MTSPLASTTSIWSIASAGSVARLSSVPCAPAAMTPPTVPRWPVSGPTPAPCMLSAAATLWAGAPGWTRTRCDLPSYSKIVSRAVVSSNIPCPTAPPSAPQPAPRVTTGIVWPFSAICQAKRVILRISLTTRGATTSSGVAARIPASALTDARQSARVETDPAI